MISMACTKRSSYAHFICTSMIFILRTTNKQAARPHSTLACHTAESGSLSAGGIGAPNFYKVLAPKWSYRSYHWSGNISPLTEPFSLLPRS